MLLQALGADSNLREICGRFLSGNATLVWPLPPTCFPQEKPEKTVYEKAVCWTTFDRTSAQKGIFPSGIKALPVSCLVSFYGEGTQTNEQPTLTDLSHEWLEVRETNNQRFSEGRPVHF